MKRRHSIFSVITLGLGALGMLLMSQTAHAAGATTTVTNTTAPYQAQTDLSLNVSLSSAVVLTIAGKASAPSTTITGGVDSLNGVGSANVEFGSMNTACSPAATAGGICVRLNDDTGARFVATLDATVTVSGVATGGSILGIYTPVTPVAAVNTVKYRTCGLLPSSPCDQTGSDAFWQVPANGLAIPDASCTACDQLASDAVPIPSGSTLEHQLALEFLDVTSAPGVTAVVVRYQAAPDPS